MPLLYALVLSRLGRGPSRRVQATPRPGPQRPHGGPHLPIGQRPKSLFDPEHRRAALLRRNRRPRRFQARSLKTPTGIAHYLEHMLFKGSQKIGTLDYEKEQVHLDRIEALYEQHFAETDPEKRAAIYSQINAENQLAAAYAIPNELDRLYTAMGERGLNAHTWVEETVYKVELPANRLAQWAKVEAERFHEPVFRLFQTELETVYEEKNRSLDNKSRVIYKAVQEQFYKDPSLPRHHARHSRAPKKSLARAHVRVLSHLLRAQQHGHFHLRRH